MFCTRHGDMRTSTKSSASNIYSPMIGAATSNRERHHIEKRNYSRACTAHRTLEILFTWNKVNACGQSEGLSEASCLSLDREISVLHRKHRRGGGYDKEESSISSI